MTKKDKDFTEEEERDETIEELLDETPKEVPKETPVTEEEVPQAPEVIVDDVVQI